MASIRVCLSEQMKQWVEAQVSSGRYHNASEYFCDLIRRDQEAQQRLQAVRAHLANGAADIDAGRFKTLSDKKDIGTFFEDLKRKGE